ncbi:uracil-DNA glycosylase [Pontibacillus yanchengensis Y32]|uniref:Uracil-DNA glycosylase n=1 Tax=Pontibacillus yanchengensis Y32 TaxID=1385514 RepID=A0A0A2TF60_9BACI|nr:hypothetical protein [Pontibacillus yanchengensis]KGP74199.1 uracil-DNA glycosylase [Pontibacillus yanchengensis Y32]
MTKRNCFQCKHFYTTWNPEFPRGCKAYGFKTKEIPSAYVLKVSGSPCFHFESKKKPTSQKPTSLSTFDVKR